MGDVDSRAQGAGRSSAIALRPVGATDGEFLYRLYAATRLAELAPSGWDDGQIETFLRMQFTLQHNHYRCSHPAADFDLILVDGTPAGRLYVERSASCTLIIDISLLPEFRGRGVGGELLRRVTAAADAARTVVSLHVERNNSIRPFYQRLGFREVELRGIYYYMERHPV